jgi:hypothetical protein
MNIKTLAYGLSISALCLVIAPKETSKSMKLIRYF